LVIGSAPGAALRVYEDPSVSGRHCVLRAVAGSLELRDLESRNGTWVGGARLARGELPPQGGSFVIGRTTVVVRSNGVPEADVEAVPSLPGLVGASLAMRRVAREVRRVAPLRGAVLIQGESGTGKDLVARALHELSGRAGAFVPINVGALTETLVDAELFGHRRGAFTGAVETRTGAFEQAHRGTLFLDEVAELSPAAQVKLLRVVEDGCVRPVGAAQVVQVDVRLVAASWASLAARAEARAFRGDLYHRLSTFVIELPPLRERRSDLPALCRVLLGRLEPELGPKHLSSAALARLVSHDWPGNVRELHGVLYRAAARATQKTILAEDVELGGRAKRVRRSGLSGLEATSLLARHAGNVSAAARAAGVPRSTFRFWLERDPGEADGEVVPDPGDG
jgi:DNA-binding NtrC family response regulator